MPDFPFDTRPSAGYHITDMSDLLPRRSDPSSGRVRISYTIPVSVHEAVKARAEREGWSQTMVVLEALKAFLKS